MYGRSFSDDASEKTGQIGWFESHHGVRSSA